VCLARIKRNEREAAEYHISVRVLVVDIGGSHAKLWLAGRRMPLKIDTGPSMTPKRLVPKILEATSEWSFDHVSIGYPGPVIGGHPAAEPWNLGRGWVRFNFQRAFKVPVRVINDAAMQALGAWKSGDMLFIGLGTGVGTATVRANGTLVPLELGHLPYRNGGSYEDYIGDGGMKHLGKRRWQKHVNRIIPLLMAAVQADKLVIGGGNARHLRTLPRGARMVTNANAARGGVRLWEAKHAPSGDI
jgi:polyphosphate glucokinase